MYISIRLYRPGKLFGKFFILAIVTVLFARQTLLAQRFNFTHYNIEHGLIQSQARVFAQSPSHHLWIGTHGGISRFDGTQFTSLTRSENGLADMSTTALLADSNGTIYIGTQNGLSVYNGKQIRNYLLPDQEKVSWVGALVKDQNGMIYLLVNEQIFVFKDNRLQPIKSPAAAKEYVTALTAGPDGKVYAAVFGKGVFELKNNSWRLRVSLPLMSKSLTVRQLLFDVNKRDKLWILTPSGIFISENSKLEKLENSILDSSSNYFLSIAQDKQSNLWIGTDRGAYCISPQKTIFFHSGNGFTDNAVNQIFRDRENNMWFGTEGAGVYRYNGDKTMVLDKGQGLSNEVVMGFATDPHGDIWMLSFGSTIVKLKAGKIVPVNLPVPDTIPYRISHLFNDRDGNIWIGTSGAGLWMYDGTGFKDFSHQLAKVPKVVRQVMQDRYGAIWLATPSGCYLISRGHVSHMNNFDAGISGLLEIGKDSILVASEKGNYLITGQERRPQLIAKKEIQKADMYSMAKYGHQVFFGTSEDGIWAWDLRKDTFQNLTRKNGLYSNTIYSLIADKQGNMWAGTGRGINKIKISSSTDTFAISGAEHSQRLVVECNQHAMYLNKNKLWVGTTKGALVFDLKPQTAKKEKPYIVLQSVKLYNSTVKKQSEVYSRADGFLLPQDLQLGFSKNHISLNFKAIYMTNPTDVQYQYRLLGLDDSFSNPTSNSSVNYQNLPPGDYVFQAQALTNAGALSDNVLQFPFTIIPAFYQTITFKLAVTLFLILSGIALQAYLHSQKTKRIQAIENVKKEERLKARRQTAEDFHDDLGNKLTRISILTDILNTKLNGEHQEEKQLIYQIKENASSLYHGTKDILWALDPKSDNLYEILCHISEFGMELCQDTAIDFSFKGIDSHLSYIQFPMEYSRNISMIFKESLNNILRHADAAHVALNVKEYEHSVEIDLRDDGKGFDPQQNHSGLGLHNIFLRARRIGATLNIDSSRENGTCTSLIIIKS